ncbi:HET-domain-containing protein, partial [Stipitochalara longipes BDJ]
VRLLRLWPGPPGYPLICSLDKVSLDDANLEYKALSYVWGDKLPEENQLSCCNLSCVCQQNIIGFQQTVHEQFTFPAYFWVDAVCIDQGNIKERSHQVSLMYEIYTKASTVIVWLGEEDEYTVPALRML